MTISLLQKLAVGAERPFHNEPFEFPGYVTGRYYTPDMAYFGVGTGNSVADRLYFAPFYPQATNTFDRLGIYNTGAGDNGEKVRVGIYNSSSGRPSSLVVDGGELTFAAAAALNVATISQSLTLNTLYFLAAVFDNTSAVNMIQDGEINSPMVSGYGLDSTQAIYPSNMFYESHAFAALPANSGGTFAASNLTPMFYLRST